MPKYFLPIALLLLTALTMLIPQISSAANPGDACTAAKAGSVEVSAADTDIRIYCDGTTWRTEQELDESGVTTKRIRQNITFGNETSICNSDAEGTLKYNSCSLSFEYCDGLAWKLMKKPASLVANWKLDESLGTIVYDSAGLRDGQMYNMESNDHISGVTGNALQFDGVDEYVEIPRSNALSLSQYYTVAGWIYIEGPGKNGLMGFFGKNQAYRFFCDNNDPCGFRIQHFDGGGTWNPTARANFLPWNEWHHIAITFNRPTITVYRDGEVFTTYSRDYSIDTGVGFYIGDIQPNFYSFDGKIDDVRVYNRALTIDEIRKLYNGGSGC